MPRIVQIIEQAGDPTSLANSALLYAKDVGGTTQAFLRASDGALTQVTSPPTGTFLNRQVFTANGTYTPTAGTKMVRIRMVGGGGGGGGVGGGGTQMGVASGGWSGSFIEKLVNPGALITGGAVTIGAAGTAGASGGGNGGTGGDSTVVIQGTTYTAKGGTGGLFAAATNGTTDTNVPAYTTGSTVGDFNVAGPPERGMTIATDAFMAPGRGGSNPLGGGGFGGNNQAGQVGTGYGAGGGGGSNYLTANQPGGAGTAGVLIIDEFTTGSLPIVGTFLNRQVFTAGGTYTPTAGTRMVRIRMAGGGGGGGAKYTLGVSTTGGGGAAGMYVEKLIDPGVLITGGAVAIGAAGAGGDNATGGTGGDTTIVIQGTTYTAKGGLGGTGANYNVSASDGGLGQSVSQTVDIQFQEPGEFGFDYATLADAAFALASGKGGSNPLGCGGAGVVASTGLRINGKAGQGYGGGGSGGIDGVAAGDVHAIGGDGTAGVIIVEEYAQGAVPFGMFLGRQIFTASGTYTPTPSTRKVRVRMVGGGGGGGGAGTDGASTGGVGAGGASGAYFELQINPGVLVTGGAVTIGAAGAAGANTGGTGGTGGDSSIVVQGTTYTAKGGLGGAGQDASFIAAGRSTAGGATQSGSSSGDVVMQEGGQAGIMGNSGGTLFISGKGGSSPLGAGGREVRATSADGNPGQGYGAGGSGGTSLDTITVSVGGAGTAGLVIVEEYTG